jgi:GT2 family glycosyltransferase
MKKKKIVSLVVLNYNGLKHLEEYFTSVFQQTMIPDEIIMMDNQCTDGSREYVAKNFPKVKIVTEDSFNTGTATGSNIGFRSTTGDYVIFQSNDIRLDKNCVKELVEVMEEDNAVGICTSVLLNYFDEKEGRLILDNAGGIVDVYGFCMQKYPSAKFEKIPDREEVFYAYGGSFIIRREIFEKIDGYDDRYFTLNDDVDLSWRRFL